MPIYSWSDLYRICWLILHQDVKITSENPLRLHKFLTGPNEIKIFWNKKRLLLKREVEGWVFCRAAFKFMAGLGCDWQPPFPFISDFTDAFGRFNDNIFILRLSGIPPSKYASQAANWHSGTVISLSQESSVHGKPLKSFPSAIVKKDTFVLEEMLTFRASASWSSV